MRRPVVEMLTGGGTSSVGAVAAAAGGPHPVTLWAFSRSSRWTHVKSLGGR